MDFDKELQSVKDGETSALLLIAALRDEEKRIGALISEVEEFAHKEAETFGEKTFKFNGFKFEIRQGSRRYSFKNIPAWVEASNKVKNVEELARLAYLNYEKNVLAADTNGEELVLPEVSYTKSSLIIKRIDTTDKE